MFNGGNPGRLYSTMGPRERQYTGAPMATIHRNTNGCGAPCIKIALDVMELKCIELTIVYCRLYISVWSAKLLTHCARPN